MVERERPRPRERERDERRDGGSWARLLAPVAFFAAATALILIVHNSLQAQPEEPQPRAAQTAPTTTGGREPGATQPTATAPAGRAATTIRVRETEFKLSPANPRVARTGVVAFRVTNAGDVTHALEVEGPKGEQETEPIEPGGSATLRVDLDKAGRYTWYCPIGDHEDRGMRGKITVADGGASGGGDERTETEPQERGGGSGGGGGGY